MLKATFLYEGKKPDTTELDSLFPLDASWLPLKDRPKTSIDPFHKILTLDWKWFKGQFTTLSDIRCIVLKDTTPKGLGLDHNGFYHLDEDNVFDFYVSNKRNPYSKAVKNGFKTSLAYMVVHEYMHGVVFKDTKDKLKAVSKVHDWVAQGTLKTEFLKYQKDNETKRQQVSLLQKTIELLHKILTSKTKPVVLNSDMLPLVKRQADQVLVDMEMLGHPMRIVQGYRSIEEQNKLYGQGRTYAGPIVTNAKGGESYHNFGVACDFVFRKEGYNASKELWQTFGAIGKRHGFEWGGDPDWIRAGFVDMPHLEMKLGHTLSDFQKGLVDLNKYK